MRPIARFAALLALAGLAVACGPTSSPSNSLQQLKDALTSVDGLGYIAIRRYTSYATTAPGSYVERITRAPDGKAKVELIQLNGKALSDLSDPQQIAAFQVTQALMAGGRGQFIATRRDFSVRDVDRFLLNYTWLQISDLKIVAGRPCVVADVRPHVLDRPSYRVWADKENYSILKYVEMLPSGAVASEMEVLSISFQIDWSQVTFPTAPVSTPVAIDASQIKGLVGFKPFEPTYLPSGFGLSTIKLATVATHPVVVWSFDDGVQELRLAQYSALSPAEPPPPGYPAEAPLKIGITVAGAHVDSRFVIEGTDFHVSTKVEPAEAMTFIESLTGMP